MHLLRTVPPRLVSSVASQHDKEINTTFENIIGRKLTARQQQQLTLAIKHGGFGLAAATETASSAFVGAWTNTLSNLSDREQKLSDICSGLTEDLDLAAIPTTQDLKDALNDLHKWCQYGKRVTIFETAYCKTKTSSMQTASHQKRQTVSEFPTVLPYQRRPRKAHQ